MITRLELLTLMNASDRLNQLDAIESLVADGLSQFTTDADAVTGLTATAAGMRRLKAMTLPPTTA
jgi:hypothetical protein